jgi:hypothetical protein
MNTPTDATSATVDGATAPIHTRAMLVSVSISTWAARRYDQKVSDETNKAHGATADAGRYNKHLFGGKERSPSHSHAVNAGSAARAALNKMTLPWSDDGWRMLPNATYMQFQEKMREQRDKFDAAAVEFVKDYPALRQAAEDHLNGMFNPAEYPSQADVAGKFRFKLDFTPVPAASDFRLTLPDDDMRAIQESVTSRVEEATKNAMKDVWRRLHTVVERYRHRLVDLDPKDRPNFVRVCTEIVESIKGLNVTADPELDALIARVENEIVSQDSTDLCKNEDVRAETVKSCESIMAEMSAFYTPEG